MVRKYPSKYHTIIVNDPRSIGMDINPNETNKSYTRGA